MRSVADDSDLEFRDGSDSIRRDAVTVEQAAELAQHPSQIIYFGAESRSSHGGFTAGNLGLNPLQIALGMTPTEDRSFDIRRIEQVGATITDRWKARRIPANQPFKPRRGCGDGRAVSPGAASQ